MTKFNYTDLFVLGGGFDLRSSNAVEFSPGPRTMETEAIHGAGDASPIHASLGVKSQTATQVGIFDDDTDKIHAALKGLGSIGPLSYGVEGIAQGAPFTLFADAIVSSYEVPVARDSMSRASASYLANGAIEIGALVEPFAALTDANGAGPSGGLDNGAPTAAGGILVVHVTALTLGGYTSLTIDLQTSEDDASGDAYADHADSSIPVFTAVGGAIAVLTGTIERWSRLFATWDGAGSAESATVTLGLIRL